MARLLDSVPPEVNTISSGCAPISAATCSRAVSTAAFAARPNGWSLDGFPKWVVRYGHIASATSAAIGVVALWSR